ncbi:Zinc finger, CCHC domain-containing protein [Linnemannia elongata]|nr:Zinc finger, CCHC domain-containing protein [Linnemannia elongata]
MTIDRQDITRALLDVILFECAGYREAQNDRYLIRDLAVAFAHARTMFINNHRTNNLRHPGDVFIQLHKLHTHLGLREYMRLLPRGNHAYFPYPTPVRCSSMDANGNAQEDHVSLPACSSQEVNDFLQNYAENVPSTFHDDIAAVVLYLRNNCWRNRKGSGGGSSELSVGGVLGVIKYSKVHNTIKRRKAERRQTHEVERQQAAARHRQQLAQEEARRKAEKQEQQRVRKEKEESEAREIRAMDVETAEKLRLQHSGGRIIHGLAKILRAAGYGPITTIATARVPIISFVEHNIRCDMSINQPMGVLNSQLIHAYQRIDSRFLGLWFGLRLLAEKHGILGGNRGYLSSYALTMMLIVFLQDVTTPPILPRLQQQGADKMSASLVDGIHCAYDQKPRNYAALASKNTKSEGQLLTEFCQHFGYTFNYLKQEVNPRFGIIRNRSVATPARSKMDSRPKDWSICILDPFIPNRNVAGNCRHNHAADIQQAFRSAGDALKVCNIDKAFKR